MKDGIIKVGAAVPNVAVGSPEKNAAEIVALVAEADSLGVKVLAFPELSVTAYTCGDIFLTEELLRKTDSAIADIAARTAEYDVIFFVGAPLRVSGKLYSCAVAISRGEVLGVVPKSVISSYGEFSDGRYFTAPTDRVSVVNVGGGAVMFGTKLLFECAEMPELVIGCELGEDISAIPPASARLVSAGATLIASLYASSEIVGRDEWRRTLVKSASGAFACPYILAGASDGESTTDMVFSGHSIIAENGAVKAENLPFEGEKLISATVDLSHTLRERMKNNTIPATDDAEFVKIPFSLMETETDLAGEIDATPFIPKGADADKTLARILEIQSRGLAKRLTAARAKSAVIGISGGLDSCLALLVTERAMKHLGRPMTDILCVTMPCYGTTGRTRGNAEKLCDEIGTSFRCVDIAASVAQHFADIGHDVNDHSVVFENAQARERTQIIMDIANGNGGFVVGTGDLSELALGWATYNGDHMSNYGVNGGVPKTLVRYLVSYCADEAEAEGKAALAEVLRDILATPVSPELLPPSDGEIAQKTEELVGPYELHDFFLYRFVRYGESAAKIRRLAGAAFDGVYSDEVITAWLKVFMRRFFTQQFKRSALPDGPKVGSISLSPRGDFRMPSDAEVWGLSL